MISNFFVLSPRGDTILAKQYRDDFKSVGAHERSHTEAFFRKIKFWDDASAIMPGGSSGDTTDIDGSVKAELEQALSSVNSSDGGDSSKKGKYHKVKGDAPPVFTMPDGLCYFHIKRNGLIFACSTARNTSPNMVIQLLTTVARIFKDYCGTLSEEAIRRNFILCYELLDEMIDYGYPQVTRTDNLKSFVYNEPILVDPVADTGSMVNPKTASASAVHKPVISSVHENGRKTSVSVNQKNEIFVDILERLSVLFSNNGYVLNSTIDGCIQMKSYLAGNPELRLALNEDLVIGRNNQNNTYGGSSVTVDDMNFNDCVNLQEFETARTLSFVPPDGEFIVINYRVTGDYPTPFRVFPSIEETEPNKLEIVVLVRAEMPSNHFGANVSIELPLPRCTVAASTNLISSPGSGAMSADYEQQNYKVLWTMKKFPGGSEQTMRVKVTLSQACTSQIRREIGPINMNFEIPMYNVSNLQVRYLRVAEAMVGYTPYRWVRYVTQSNSYVCRM